MIGAGYAFLKERRIFLFLSLWFILLWLSYFSSWMQSFGGGIAVVNKSRFFIGFYPIIYIFSSIGVQFILEKFNAKIQISYKYIFSIVVIIFIILFLPYTIMAKNIFSDKKHLLETQIPELAEKDFPKNCIIIAHWPTILKSTTQLNVIDINLFLNDSMFQKRIMNDYKCVLFFEDFMCELLAENKEGRCQELKDNFQLQEAYSYYKENIKYIFYEVKDKKKK